MRAVVVIGVALLLSGCSTNGYIYHYDYDKLDEKGKPERRIVEQIKLTGWGAKKVNFTNGASLEKQEPIDISIPDIAPITM